VIGIARLGDDRDNFAGGLFLGFRYGGRDAVAFLIGK
jgi:hypothetical protein